MVVTNCHRQLGTCQKRWSQPLSEPRLCSSGGQYLSQKRRILERQRGTLATEKAAKQQRNQRVHQGNEEEETAENMEDFNLERVLLEVVAELAAGSLSK